MAYGFSALFSRMNYIDRWGLMRNARRETLAEHSAQTAALAHLLAAAAAELFGAAVSPERVVAAALYHDLSETLTGDMPTPVKYRDDGIRESYKRVEREAEQQVCAMLPAPLQGAFSGYITGDALNDREKRILKAADKLGALLKCIEERRAGNAEFESAERSTRAALEAMALPEVGYFFENFLPAHSLNLDELMQGEK